MSARTPSLLPTRLAAYQLGISDSVFRARAKKLGLVPHMLGRADYGWTAQDIAAVAAFAKGGAQ